MKIICHRGFWTTKKSQNSLAACEAGMKSFDGIEVDLKNHFGKIVLSHDPLSRNHSAPKLDQVFRANPDSFFALNIKEDGLSENLANLIKKHKIKNYMCFDLSIPEKQQYLQRQLKVFERFGDLDPWLATGENLVIDVFQYSKWARTLKSLMAKKGKKGLFIISPELHGQPHLPVWTLLKKQFSSHSAYFLCTDFPEEADLFFNK